MGNWSFNNCIGSDDIGVVYLITKCENKSNLPFEPFVGLEIMLCWNNGKSYPQIRKLHIP